MPYVYAGKLLQLDLTEGRWSDLPISEDQVQKWTLGSGLAARMFYDMMDPSIDALDPRSPLLIFNGLLSGTFAPTGCRSSFCGRSPLTGIWNEANLGSHWGAELRFAGYDGLIITGRSKEPVYLWLDGTTGTIELRPARHVWGTDHYETTAQLLAETDPKAKVASIGPAGENLVRFASVMSGGPTHARAAGRGGMGAVMGSKNLKAIVVRGHNRPDYVDLKDFNQFVKSTNAWLKDNSVALSKLGTAGGVPTTEKTGDIPLRNWYEGAWPEGTSKISGQVIHETIWLKHTFCFACPIGCGKEVEVKAGPYKMHGHGPEYETLAGFGGNLKNDNLDSIARLNDLCNRYGLDTISTSATLAFACEAFEKGYITRKDTGGIELVFGNADVIIEMVHKIARREGIGALLADGTRAMADRLGGEAWTFAVHVKGMEVPYHDPRAFVSMAINYATSNRGACHLEALTYWNGLGIPQPGLGYPIALDRFNSEPYQAKLCYDWQNYMATYNPLGLCKFIFKGSVGPDTVAELLNKSLGWNWQTEDVMRLGERLFNLKRLINMRYGISRKDDILPPRLLNHARPDGGAANILPDLDKMLPWYYELRGWNSQGVPTPDRLAALGLADLAI